MQTRSSSRATVTSVYLTDDEKRAAALLAARDDRSVSYFIAQLVRERMSLEADYLNQQGGN